MKIVRYLSVLLLCFIQLNSFAQNYGVNTTTTTSSPVSISTSGEGYVDVHAYNAACGLSANSKRFHTRYGVPVIQSTLINGIADYLYGYPAEVPNGSRLAIPSYNAASYSWSVLYGTAAIVPVMDKEHMWGIDACCLSQPGY